MIFIYGGIYQGKKDFAKKKFGIKDIDILHINEEEIDFTDGDIIGKKCFYNVENIVKRFVDSDREKEILAVFDKLDLKDKILIMTDLSQGVVPIEKKDRKFREYSGRLARKLAEKADEVYRIFAGLEQKLK